MNHYKKHQKMKRQLSVASLKDNNNFSDKAHFIRSHLSTKRQRRIARTLVALGAVGTIAHETSTTLSPLLIKNKHKTQNEVIVNLDTKKQLGLDTLYKTDDKETNVIMDLMAGYADKKEFNEVLKKYGYDSIVPINKVSHQDPALYKTLRTMHQAYGNPHITIGEAFENPLTGEKDPERASFDGEDNRINIHNIKDKKIDFGDPTSRYFQDIFYTDDMHIPLSTKENRQRYLINNRIAELAHAIQLKRDGAIKMGIDVAIDETSVLYKHNKLYRIPGTFEYEAHSIIEPKLVQEFIERYVQFSDIYDPLTQYQIGVFYSGYFDNFSDPKKAEEWLIRSTEGTNKTTKNNNKYSCFLLGNRYLKSYQDSLEAYGCIPSADSAQQIRAKNKTQIEFNKTIHYYGKSAKAGSVEAYFRIIGLYKHYGFDWSVSNAPTDSGTTNGYKEGITRSLELLDRWPTFQRAKPTLTEETHASILADLSELYMKNGQLKEARIYLEKAKETMHYVPSEF